MEPASHLCTPDAAPSAHPNAAPHIILPVHCCSAQFSLCQCQVSSSKCQFSSSGQEHNKKHTKYKGDNEEEHTFLLPHAALALVGFHKLLRALLHARCSPRHISFNIINHVALVIDQSCHFLQQKEWRRPAAPKSGWRPCLVGCTWCVLSADLVLLEGSQLLGSPTCR